MGRKSEGFMGFFIFGIAETLATFHSLGKMLLIIHWFIISEITGAIYSATGLMNFVEILSSPVEQSFLSVFICLITSSDVTWRI